MLLRPVHTEGLIDCSEEVPDRYRSFRQSNHLTSPYADNLQNLPWYSLFQVWAILLASVVSVFGESCPRPLSF